MKIVKKGIIVALSLVMAQSIAFTSYDGGNIYAAQSSQSYSSTAIKTTVSKVTLNKSSANLIVGQSLSLKATASPTGASTKFSWTSSDKRVVTVDSNGKVKAVGKGIGIRC